VARLLPGIVVKLGRSMKRNTWTTAPARGPAGQVGWALPVLAFLFAFALSSHASAYAWMIRHEYSSCATCHADPSGGELLTLYGRVTSDAALRTQYGSGGEQSDKSGLFWGLVDLPKQLLLSGSYRSLSVTRPSESDAFKFVPVMMGDIYGQLTLGPVLMGGSVGIAKVREGSLHARPAQVTTNGDDQVNMISRTHYVGLQLNDSMWLRAGRLNLPFGVRIPEHTMWVREATRSDRESDQQHSVAFAYVGERVRLEAQAILGNYQIGPDQFRERGYSAFIEGIGDGNIAAGVSSKVTFAKEDRLTGEKDSLRQAHGLMMRWAPARQFVLMAEADALFRTSANAGYVGFVQGDYEPLQGLHFILTGEVLDEGAAITTPPQVVSPGVGQPKLGMWGSIDWFFWTQLELRVDAVVRQNDPFTILSQFHLYL
jgi:hypothetical protein